MQCKTKRKSLSSLLHSAFNNSYFFAYQYFNEPGYTAIVRKEVFYIIQWKSVFVKLNPSIDCLREQTKSRKEWLYDTFSQEQCKTKRQLIHLLLSSAFKNSNFFAYQYFDGPGYTTIIRGECMWENEPSFTFWQTRFTKSFREPSGQPDFLLQGICRNAWEYVHVSMYCVITSSEKKRDEVWSMDEGCLLHARISRCCNSSVSDHEGMIRV